MLMRVLGPTHNFGVVMHLIYAAASTLKQDCHALGKRGGGESNGNQHHEHEGSGESQQRAVSRYAAHASGYRAKKRSWIVVQGAAQLEIAKNTDARFLFKTRFNRIKTRVFRFQQCLRKVWRQFLFLGRKEGIQFLHKGQVFLTEIGGDNIVFVFSWGKKKSLLFYVFPHYLPTHSRRAR